MTQPVMIFSHPNHELPVFGTVQRLQPQLIFLTDGGGPERVDDSRRGLASIGALDRATFLGHPEDALYQALLDPDTGFLRQLALEVREVLRSLDFDTVYCDAIEFYNPVHDLALPLTLAALEPWPGVPVFEVPLIYQVADGAEHYAIQRVPPALQPDGVWMDLRPDEWRNKLRAQQEVYGCLTTQLGGLIDARAREGSRREFFLRARRELPVPPEGQVLRYDRRGEELRRTGQVERSISYAAHYTAAYRQLRPAAGHAQPARPY